MAKKESAEKAVRDIRRKTRRRFSAAEKIRIVIEGLRGEKAELTRARLSLRISQQALLALLPDPPRQTKRSSADRSPALARKQRPVLLWEDVESAAKNVAKAGTPRGSQLPRTPANSHELSLSPAPSHELPRVLWAADEGK